jgi:phospholipid-translocating ATPase
MWANTVLASGRALGLVLYVGGESRFALNTRLARSKFGRLDGELNRLSKLLFVFMLFLAAVLTYLGN